MAKISIVTSGHFCTNPRVWKEADALTAADHDVTVIGVWYDPQQAELDMQMRDSRRWRHEVAMDLRANTITATMRRTWHRIRTRYARHALNRGTRDPHALGYAANALLQSASRHKADLTIVHLELGFWVGAKLHHLGRNVGVDFEDWHSENYPAGTASTSQLGFYRSLEQEVAMAASHRTTTSKAMANALSVSFGIAPPVVVYNGSRSRDGTGRVAPSQGLRILWFSQTIGKRRGLEDLFGALPHVRGDWSVDLIGNANAETRSWLKQQLPEEVFKRVRILAPVPPDQLSQLVAKYDAGLALEIPDCRNKDLTVSNKIIEYLQCGLSVAATDTAGQREALGMVSEGGRLYRSGEHLELARILDAWSLNPGQIRDRRREIAMSASRNLAYEQNVPRLLASIECAVAQSFVNETQLAVGP